MSTHPSSLALEAFACGEESTLTKSVREHLATCGACDAFVKRFTEESAAFASTSVDEMIARAEKMVEHDKLEGLEPKKIAAAVSPEKTSVKSNVVPFRARAQRASFLLIPLITAAACLFVYLRQPHDDVTPRIVSSNGADDTFETPSTSFKGEMQIAVVRERDGQQKRFTRDVSVRDGDRVRIEVALDRNRTIMAGVLADDGTFVALMPEGQRGAGTHFSDNAAHFDADPTRGYVIVGTPDAIARSIALHKPDGVNSMRLSWEAPSP